jgi:hypothetical protein
MARADGGHVGLVAGCMAVAAGAGFGEAEVDHRAQGQRGRDGLDVLTLNRCLAGVAVGVGALLKQILMQISPLFDAVPVFPPAMVGGLLSMVGLVWNVLMVLLLKAFSFKPLLFEPFLGGGLITTFAPWRSAAWGWDSGQRCAWHSPSAPWWWACACSERCAAGAKARGRDREDSAA